MMIVRKPPTYIIHVLCVKSVMKIYPIQFITLRIVKMMMDDIWNFSVRNVIEHRRVSVR